VTDFQLDPRLAKDTVHLGDLLHCAVLLVDDSRFPWLILVPRYPALREILDLRPDHREGVRREIDWVADKLRTAVPCDKLNIAALGNVVAQLHIHVIARVKGDAAWPKPVWAMGEATAYDAEHCAVLADKLRDVLGLN
jgi:diadenosine tetraphosphate (Ap4A) HIT family hydrolase